MLVNGGHCLYRASREHARVGACAAATRPDRSAPPQPVPVPAEDADAGQPDPADPGQDAATARAASTGGPDTEGKQAPGEDGPDAPAGDEPPEAAPSPVGRRPEVVKARRRLLTTLIALTGIAVALAVTRVDAYW